MNAQLTYMTARAAELRDVGQQARLAREMRARPKPLNLISSLKAKSPRTATALEVEGGAR